MKKILSFLFVAMLGGAVYAGPVSPEKALQVARSVFAAEPGTKAAPSSELSIIWDGEFAQTKSALPPAFYVITRPEGGFVMVAGSYNVQPVLGFSFENPFVVEDMPDNVRGWMEQYKAYVRSAESPTQEIRDQWARYETTKTTTPPITSGFKDAFTASLTNEWNQTNPANFYCPKNEGDSHASVCGCVALATAEIMAWFGTANLSSVTGTVPEYTYTSKNSIDITIPAHDLGTEYDWIGLQNLRTASQFYDQIVSWTQSKKYSGEGEGTELTPLGYNLARLVYDLGTILQAKFNASSTSASIGNVGKLVAPMMGYNNMARFVYKRYYSNSEWQQLMKDQVTRHPVMYDGSSTETGGSHAYVADGYATYDNALMFHINLGWGGSNNGYYTLDVQFRYDNDHGAVIDFYPNPGASEQVGYMGFSNDGGIEYVSGYNTGSLSVVLRRFFNYGTVPFEGAIYLGLNNADGMLQETTFYQSASLNPNYGWKATGTLNTSFTSLPAFGDKLKIYYQETGKDTFLPFVIRGELSYPTEIPFFPAAAIKVRDSYSVGDLFVFELTNVDYEYNNATWTVTTPSGRIDNYTMDSDAAFLTEAGEYKITCATTQETVVAFITVTAP